MKKKAQPLKTTFSAYAAMSLDGRISLTEKTLPNWTSKEDWNFLQKSLSRADAVVVGRNTYKAAAEQLRKRTTYVLSRRIKTLRRYGSITFVNPALTDLKELLSVHRTVAILGGGGVYGMMLEKGMLNELFVTIEPLVFGRGKQVFINGGRVTRLRLISARTLNHGGTLLLHYTILYSPITITHFTL